MAQSDNLTPHKALEYDADIRDTIPFYDCILEETIDLVKMVKPEPESWLDTGCGTGTLVTKAFPYFPNTLFILSDPSESMLIEARRCLNSIPQTQLKFLDPSGTENLSVYDVGQVQIITALQSHHYLDTNMRRTATRKCFEMLGPDGMYVTFENICPESKNGIDIGLNRWARYQISIRYLKERMKK